MFNVWENVLNIVLILWCVLLLWIKLICVVNFVLIMIVLKNFLINFVLNVLIFFLFNVVLKDKYGCLFIFIMICVNVLFIGMYIVL